MREKKQAKAIGSLTDNFFPLGQVKKALKSKKSKKKKLLQVTTYNNNTSKTPS